MRRTGRIGGIETGVAFADLVDFTRLGERLPASEIGSVAGRLAELASEAAEPPVRLVKTIGDAAMLDCRETGPLLDAVIDLVEAAEGEGEDFPQLRAGVAYGHALPRWGDLYGAPVNLASRVTAVARPGTVLVTEEVREQAADRFRFSRTPSHRFKGIEGRLHLYRARRLDA